MPLQGSKRDCRGLPRYDAGYPRLLAKSRSICNKKVFFQLHVSCHVTVLSLRDLPALGKDDGSPIQAQMPPEDGTLATQPGPHFDSMAALASLRISQTERRPEDRILTVSSEASSRHLAGNIAHARRDRPRPGGFEGLRLAQLM